MYTDGHPRSLHAAPPSPCPMVVSVGQAPGLGAAASSTPGAGVSEYAVAGSRIGRPINIGAGRHTGIPFPAEAEIVFEDFMAPPAVRAVPEGPFGEWPGYYAPNSRPDPVLEVRVVYHRNEPIIVGAPPMRPTLPCFWSGTDRKSTRLHSSHQSASRMP